MTNRHIAATLFNIATILDLAQDNIYRVRAYRYAARRILALRGATLTGRWHAYPAQAGRVDRLGLAQLLSGTVGRSTTARTAVDGHRGDRPQAGTTAVQRSGCKYARGADPGRRTRAVTDPLRRRSPARGTTGRGGARRRGASSGGRVAVIAP